MFIRSPHRSKVFIGLSTLFVALIVALAALRADVTEAQQNAGDFPPSSSPPRAVVVERHNYGLPPVGFPIPPNSQNNPAGSPWYTPPNQSRPKNAIGPLPAMPTAAPMTEGDRRAAELAGRIRQTRDPEEREQLRSQLRETLNAAFDQRREQQLHEIQQLEQQLEAIRKLDEKRQQRKEEIVQRRMSELLSEPDALDWEPKRFQGQYGFPTPVSPTPFLPPMPMPLGAPTPMSNLQPRNQNQADFLQPPAPSQSRSAIIFSNDATVERVDEGMMRFYGNRPYKVSETVDQTTLPNANDAIIFTLTDSIMEKIDRLRKVREDLKRLPGLGAEVGKREQLTADETRILSSIKISQSAWEMIGQQKQHDVASTKKALELAEQRFEIFRKSYEQGNVAELVVMTEEATLERLKADASRVQQQYAAWEKLDEQVQAALKKMGVNTSAATITDSDTRGNEERTLPVPAAEPDAPNVD